MLNKKKLKLKLKHFFTWNLTQLLRFSFSVLIFDCEYFRLTKMDAVKQKAAILSPRAVHPAVTASIS